MQNHLLLLCFAVMLSFNATAQQQSVVASAGDHSQTAMVQLSWTLGEPCVATLMLPDGQFLTEGFQQPELIRVEAFQNAALPGAFDESPRQGITIAPNPVSSSLIIQIPSTWNKEKLTIELFDAYAQQLQTGTITQGDVNAMWDMSAYPAGTYWLRFVATETKQVQTFKVIKTQ